MHHAPNVPDATCRSTVLLETRFFVPKSLLFAAKMAYHFTRPIIASSSSNLPISEEYSPSFQKRPPEATLPLEMRLFENFLVYFLCVYVLGNCVNSISCVELRLKWRTVIT